MGGAAAEKRKAFEEWLQRRDRVTHNSWYSNRGQMHVLLNGNPLEEVECF